VENWEAAKRERVKKGERETTFTSNNMILEVKTMKTISVGFS
jgi:hypothetical protein